jgi:hypothetical protein
MKDNMHATFMTQRARMIISHSVAPKLDAFIKNYKHIIRTTKPTNSSKGTWLSTCGIYSYTIWINVDSFCVLSNVYHV